MAQSITYEIIANELESYEKKILTFSKLIYSDISKMNASKNYCTELSEQETENLINMIYRIMGETEPDLAKMLFDLWEQIKSKS